jgi:hypothetical protein
MATISVNIAAVSTIVFGVALGGSLTAQGALAQLGLTEAAARNFVLGEIKSPAGDRRAEIAITGTRAFLKLPPAARGPAATALFTWAKAYVNSPAFTTSYDSYRKGVVGTGRRAAPSVDETLEKEMEEQRAGLEAMKNNLATSGLPPAEQEKILAAWKEAAAQANGPEVIEARRKALEAERADARAGDATRLAELNEQLPADPRRLFARRLRDFLDHTADVNFSARTINLTGGTDGIEFRDAADRRRHWVWQEAALVGPEATAAARAAAQAWLKELEQ